MCTTVTFASEGSRWRVIAGGIGRSDLFDAYEEATQRTAFNLAACQMPISEGVWADGIEPHAY